MPRFELKNGQSGIGPVVAVPLCAHKRTVGIDFGHQKGDLGFLEGGHLGLGFVRVSGVLSVACRRKWGWVPWSAIHDAKKLGIGGEFVQTVKLYKQ